MRTHPFASGKTAGSQMTKLAANNPGRIEAAIYEICLQGHLDARWAAQLEVSGLVHDSDGTTVLRVVAADQSALHGLLQRIRDLALPLVSVTRLPTRVPEQPSTNLIPIERTLK